ncbi:hypothetical protein [Nostoc sp.]|uniref:hypothetical protein n=1 Tax=Nostoc sp. TaxID=1180 RepID=UPI002FF6E6B7
MIAVELMAVAIATGSLAVRVVSVMAQQFIVSPYNMTRVMLPEDRFKTGRVHGW